MKTRTHAIMFTDIKGYAALTASQSHDQNEILLNTYKGIVHPIVSTFSGVLVKSIGDAFMAVFSSPTEAVQCAMAIEDRLWFFNQNRPKRDEIKVRIAINVGEMRVKHRDYFGEPVNIAARMEGVTPAGEIYISEATFLTMNRQNVATDEVGSFEFKGVPEPIKIFQIPRYVDPRSQKVVFKSADDDEQGGSETSGEQLSNELDRNGPPYGGIFEGRLKRTKLKKSLYILIPILVIMAVLFFYFQHRIQAENRDQLLTKIESLITQEELKTAAELINQFGPASAKERFRRDAARRRLAWALYRKNDYKGSQHELDWLLTDSTQEPQDLLLKGHLKFAMTTSENMLEDYGKGLEIYEEALTIDARLGNDEHLGRNIIHCYYFPQLRVKTDWLVEGYIKKRAAGVLADELKNIDLDFSLRHWFISRLEKLGRAELIDWVEVSIRDLIDGNCKYKKKAINKLEEEGDPLAIGPLLQLASKKECASRLAREVAGRLADKLKDKK
jgi:class 3 adenylate cyclase